MDDDNLHVDHSDLTWQNSQRFLQSTSSAVSPDALNFSTGFMSGNIQTPFGLHLLGSAGYENNIMNDDINGPDGSADCERCGNMRQAALRAVTSLKGLTDSLTHYKIMEKRFETMKQSMQESVTYVDETQRKLAERDLELERIKVQFSQAQQREQDLTKQVTTLEGKAHEARDHLNAANSFREKYNRSCEVANSLQEKRVKTAAQFKDLLDVSERMKTEKEEMKRRLDIVLNEKKALQERTKAYKKYVPLLYRSLDEIVKHGSHNLPSHSTKRIDQLFSPDVKLILLGEPASRATCNSASDDEAAANVESLLGIGHDFEMSDSDHDIANDGTLSHVSPFAYVPSTVMQAPKMRGGRGGRGRGARGARTTLPSDDRPSVSVDPLERDKQFMEQMRSKLSNIPQQDPSTSIPSCAVNTIHGKKGLTVREQQAATLQKKGVKERAAEMRRAKEVERPPPSSTGCSGDEAEKRSTLAASDDMLLPECSSPDRSAVSTELSKLSLDMSPSPSPQKRSAPEEPIFDDRQIMRVFHEGIDDIQPKEVSETFSTNDTSFPEHGQPSVRHHLDHPFDAIDTPEPLEDDVDNGIFDNHDTCDTIMSHDLTDINRDADDNSAPAIPALGVIKFIHIACVDEIQPPLSPLPQRRFDISNIRVDPCSVSDYDNRASTSAGASKGIAVYSTALKDGYAMQSFEHSRNIDTAPSTGAEFDPNLEKSEECVATSSSEIQSVSGTTIRLMSRSHIEETSASKTTIKQMVGQVSKRNKPLPVNSSPIIETQTSKPHSKGRKTGPYDQTSKIIHRATAKSDSSNVEISSNISLVVEADVAKSAIGNIAAPSETESDNRIPHARRTRKQSTDSMDSSSVASIATSRRSSRLASQSRPSSPVVAAHSSPIKSLPSPLLRRSTRSCSRGVTPDVTSLTCIIPLPKVPRPTRAKTDTLTESKKISSVLVAQDDEVEPLAEVDITTRPSIVYIRPKVDIPRVSRAKTVAPGDSKKMLSLPSAQADQVQSLAVTPLIRPRRGGTVCPSGSKNMPLITSFGQDAKNQPVADSQLTGSRRAPATAPVSSSTRQHFDMIPKKTTARPVAPKRKATTLNVVRTSDVRSEPPLKRVKSSSFADTDEPDGQQKRFSRVDNKVLDVRRSQDSDEDDINNLVIADSENNELEKKQPLTEDESSIISTEIDHRAIDQSKDTMVEGDCSTPVQPTVVVRPVPNRGVTNAMVEPASRKRVATNDGKTSILAKLRAGATSNMDISKLNKFTQSLGKGSRGTKLIPAAPLGKGRPRGVTVNSSVGTSVSAKSDTDFISTISTPIATSSVRPSGRLAIGSIAPTPIAKSKPSTEEHIKQSFSDEKTFFFDALRSELDVEQIEALHGTKGIDVLPADEVGRYLADYCASMNAGDQWRGVIDRFNNKRFESVHNKKEQHAVQVAYQLTHCDFYLPFVKCLVMKMLSQTDIDQVQCSRNVRMICLVLQTEKKIVSEASLVPGYKELRCDIFKSLITHLVFETRSPVLAHAMMFILMSECWEFLEWITLPEYSELRGLIFDSIDVNERAMLDWAWVERFTADNPLFTYEDTSVMSSVIQDWTTGGQRIRDLTSKFSFSQSIACDSDFSKFCRILALIMSSCNGNVNSKKQKHDARVKLVSDLRLVVSDIVEIFSDQIPLTGDSSLFADVTLSNRKNITISRARQIAAILCLVVHPLSRIFSGNEQSYKQHFSEIVGECLQKLRTVKYSLERDALKGEECAVEVQRAVDLFVNLCRLHSCFNI